LSSCCCCGKAGAIGSVSGCCCGKAGAICELLANPDRAKQMGADGRDWVIKNWQLSTWSEKFNKVLIGN